jgi:sugar O-acyltransferase (sialic acid O-acetyltransferase NeuD family)
MKMSSTGDKINIIWGGTGLARAVRPILQMSGTETVAVFDNALTQSPFIDVPLLGGDVEFIEKRCDFIGAGFVVAIGGAHGRSRLEKAKALQKAGLVPLQAVHHRSFIASSVVLGSGNLLLGMSMVSEDVVIGNYSIINIGVCIDHECRIGDGVHIMPGATLAGLVEVGDYATIGSGATILPRIKIGTGAFVGAGAVVTKDVPDDTTVAGVPARRFDKND